MSIYRVEHLQLSYTDPDGYVKKVLSDVHLSIDAGECIGILGKSGGGKTQLVQALARLNEFRGGVVTATSNFYTTTSGEVWDLSERRRLLEFRISEIGYIFQEPFSYFNPTIKIGKQIFLSEHPGHSRLEDIKTWFSRIGLTDDLRILSSYPHQLSGGQLQRLAILSCLIRNPRIVIADEITASLDPAASKRILQLLVDLKKEFGFALLWVTHDASEAMQFCDRIWVVEEGKLISDEPAKKHFLNGLKLDKSRKLPESSPEILKLSHIFKSYTRTGPFGQDLAKNQVLDDVSLLVRRGEILGITGPSGGGKSTLARIIAGLESWDSGELFFKSRPVLNGTGLTKDIIYLFQDAYSSLNPKLTCKELLDEALKAGQQQVDRASLLSLTQLDSSVLNKKAISLSGGLRQRFALARALAVNPELLIMDESVNALDIPLQKQILDMLIQHLRTHSLTLLFISHQMEVVRQFSDRQVHLSGGHLTEL